ncbi:MAG: DUF1792 domain-containing protein [Clostridia bacterium]|nr:DUF1792 domain-containing protein [Clostridia bacterium]
MFIKRIFKSVEYRLNLFGNRIKYDLNWGGVRRNNPHVLTSIETINKIKDEKLSLARFGDGEFYLMLGLDYSPFQKCTPELTKDLLEVVSNTSNGIMIGLPDTFNDVSRYEKKSRDFWKSFMGEYRNRIIEKLPSNYLDIVYANTNSTRFYSDLEDKTACIPIIESFKEVWKGRPIICIEGEKTRLGVGNDLFEEASEFKRILLPAKNAYEKIYEVMDWIEENKNEYVKENTLFILAAGMAATVLAYRLWQKGYQALDLGHIDIQYEYYLRKAKDKIAIPGKYTNENSNGRNPDDSIVDESYSKQIIANF